LSQTAPAIDRTRPLPRPRRLPTVLTRPEVTTLLARANPHSLTEHHDRCCLPLMRHAGLHAAEVLALIVSDLDWVSSQRAVPQGKEMNDRILWRHETLLEGLRFSRARLVCAFPPG
jgi:integrase